MKTLRILPAQLYKTGFFILAVVMASCANIVAPTGGKKDITPPKVIKTEPPNFSTRFAGNTIRLYFDEYVQLKDESRQMMVSPPPEKVPEARIKGKSIIVTLPGTLLPNTTYSIQFGTAIQDYNEGNILQNYTYVFSTGVALDSLSLKGSVLNAENLAPVAKIIVCLYSNTGDSVIFKEKPRYIARTGEDGTFSLENLGGGAYKMIALKDENADLVASLPAEEIAFPDSLVHPVYLPHAADTSQKDSLVHKQTVNRELTLYLFKERDSTLRFQKAYLEKPYQLILPFSLPVNKVSIKPFGGSLALKDWYQPEWSATHDTLTCWIFPSVTQDSLTFALSAGKNMKDTVKLDLRRFGKGGKYRKDKDKTGKLKVNSSVGPDITAEDVVVLTFSYPIAEASLQALRLIRGKDTLSVTAHFTDSLKRKLQLNFTWEENSTYQLVIPKGTLKDWTGQFNDSLVIRYSSRPAQDYGTLLFHFSGSEPGQYILQLVDSKERVLKETIINTEGSWKLNYLIAGQYKVKAIRDKNNNSHWDSGNYRLKIQPEKISYYPKTLEIRGNWDLEEKWKW